MKIETERICVRDYVLAAIDMKRKTTVILVKPRVFECVKNLQDWK